VGAALAALHESRGRAGKRVTVASQRRDLREACGAIIRSCPGLRPRLEALCEELGATTPDSEERPVQLHGSFRLNHVLVAGPRVAFVDLDSLRVGPAAYDVANLLASLHYLEGEGRMDRRTRREIFRAFLAGYRGNGRPDPCPRAVLWFLSTLLIEKQAA